MNRRTLLAALGTAFADPKAVSAKAMESVISGGPHQPGRIISSVSLAGQNKTPDFWGSDIQNIIHASRIARQEIPGDRYAHMKSWGPAFRRMVITHEHIAEARFEKECAQNEEFLARVLEALK